MSESKNIITITMNVEDAEAITHKTHNWTQNYQKAMYTMRDAITKELENINE